MTDSARETALKALDAVLSAIDGPTVLRNPTAEVKVPAGGLIVLSDGDPGEPETYLSPLAYGYSHAAEMVVAVQDKSGRDAALDQLLQAIGAAIAADDTLGGAVEMASLSAPELTDEPFEGAAAVKAARLTVTLDYLTTNPLS